MSLNESRVFGSFVWFGVIRTPRNFGNEEQLSEAARLSEDIGKMLRALHSYLESTT